MPLRPAADPALLERDRSIPNRRRRAARESRSREPASDRVADPALDNARTIASAEKPTSNAPFYFDVRGKFAFALLVSGAWLALTIVIALPWIAELSALIGRTLALLAVGGIALVPGFMNAFLIASLLLDRRPARSSRAAIRRCRS